jgi:hypothetical protein
MQEQYAKKHTYKNKELRVYKKKKIEVSLFCTQKQKKRSRVSPYLIFFFLCNLYSCCLWE